MKGPDALQAAVGRLRTAMGAFRPGQPVLFRGHALHGELKDAAWLDLYLFGITGRRFSPRELRLLEAIWAYTSYPDARIWNNRVAALAGSARSTGTLAMAAALAVSEASIYGRGIDIRAISFLRSCHVAIARGKALARCVEEELEIHRGIAGYGRPITSGDERIDPIMALAADLGLADGPHVRLAYDIEAHLLAGRWRWRMNYAGIAAALLADLGFSPQQYYLYLFPAFLAGMQPCFIEASEKPAGTLFPLPCTHIQYQGPARRPWR